jgi:hypothetical protein
MKLKSLIQSKGERAVKTILESRLAKTPFQVAPKVRLASSIEWEPEQNGSLKEPVRLFNYFTRAELDFLIFSRDSGLPFLAVEFDSRYHETDAKARERDILKNRICSMAGLPLLRVRNQEIQPLFTRDSFLSYLVDVILRYKTADERKGYSPYDEIRRHDLTDIRMLRDLLAKKHHMIPSDGAVRTPTAKFAYEFHPGGADYASSETDAIYEGQIVLSRLSPSLTPKKWPVVRRISKKLRLRTSYRTTTAPRPPLPKGIFDPSAEAYLKWLETDPWYRPDLPGVNWLYMAWNILEALCLKQLLVDADSGELL